MDSLFEAVREAASRPIWSRGVELVRANAVTVEQLDAREAHLRVAVSGRPIAPLVTLLLDADAWSCECAGDEDPCEHVAAAVIALRRAREEGRELPSVQESGAGSLHYELRRVPGGLALDRVVVRGAERTPLAAGLRAIASGRTPGPQVAATETDLAVDDAIQGISGRTLSRGAALRVLKALAGSEHVSLDGVPVRTSGEPLTPEARLSDADGDFLLEVDLRPGVSAALGEDLVLCGDVIRPLRETKLEAHEIAAYAHGKRFRAGDAAKLASEILPDLARRIAVDVRTKRLPRTTRSEPPRARVTTSRDGNALVARADVVYGDPPAARVVAGHLVAIQGVVPIRDEAGERAAARRIQSELALPVGSEVKMRGEDAIALAEKLARFGGAIAGDAHRAFFRAPPLVAHLAADDRFDVWFQSGEGDARERRAGGDAVFRAWSSGASHVLLPGGGLAPLPADWLARFGREIADLLEARDARGILPRATLPALALLADRLDLPRPAALGSLAALVDGFAGIPHATLPADLGAELRSYQRAGIDWLCFLRDAGLGALLADDMGLGKTLQVLATLRSGERALVVAPTSVLWSWAAEAKRFRPALSVSIHHGQGRALDPRADLTLTSYALLRLDAELLGAVAWDVAVLDESQAIKNADSQAARTAHALRAKWRVAMTGTPVENRLEELWSQLHFANPGLLGSRAAFDERHARPIANGDDAAAATLRARIRPFVLRRRKAEVAPELPPRIEVVLRVELDAEERRVYDAVRAATRNDVVAKLAAGGSVLAALEALLRLRQAACHPALVPGQRAETSSKVALLVEELSTTAAEGHKALVFSQWTSLLDLVEPHLAAAGIAWTRLDGSTRDRAGVVATFQGDAGPPVLLLSLGAGGVGLNLTAADHVFLLDPWWNPAVEEQAADRAHRIGQTKPVLVHRLVAADTVEERVLALQQAKRALADAALGEAGAAASLRREDLLALLE